MPSLTSRLRLSPRNELILTLTILGLAVAMPAVALMWSTRQILDRESRHLRDDYDRLHRLQLQAAALEIADQIRAFAHPTPDGRTNTAQGIGRRFLELLKQGQADSVLILDDEGRPLYPAPLWKITASTPQDDAATRQLEILREEVTTNAPVEGFLRTIRNLESQDLGSARTLSGRLVIPGLEWAALSLMDPAHPEYRRTRESLDRHVRDYSDPLMPAGQRLFLRERLRSLGVEDAASAEEAERLGLVTATSLRRPEKPEVLERARGVMPVWMLRSADEPILWLFREERLRQLLGTVAQRALAPQGYSASLRPIPEGNPAPQGLQVPIGDAWSGWELHLDESRADLEIQQAIRRQAFLHLLTAVCAIALGGVLGGLAVRRFLHQARSTQVRHDFLSLVSHELRTPLTSIRMLVDSLAGDPDPDPERTRQYLGIIARENHRLSRLVDDFLTFSRLERGRMAYDFQTVAPEEITEAAVASVQNRFSAPGCDFRVETSPDLPPIEADLPSLTTALINLLENAFKYSGPEKRILLTTTRLHDEVCFAVVDNGCGFEAEHRERIFEKFYRIQRQGQGSAGVGLGLHIVKAIIEAHHGHIEVASNPGHGSRFAIHIPIATPNPREPWKPQHP
jgi:signal transduction histidine kinase